VVTLVYFKVANVVIYFAELFNMKTILVTGSTDGIGKQTALELAKKGHRVIIHGRKIDRCLDVREHIRSRSGNKYVDFVAADLSSLKAARVMAEEIKMNYKNLDILINNAGVFEQKKKITEDNLERTFVVNHLSVFLLTGSLLDLLKKSPAARIVTVSSMAHASKIDFDNLQGEKYYDGHEAYGRSKLCNILFTFELAERVKGITVNTLHPGVIGTKLLQVGWGMGGASLESGAQTSIYLALADELEEVSGKYFSNRRESKPAAICSDSQIRRKLWKISEILSGFTYPTF
jgi:NAD(P)-dependent dehydrogenase (short-subunit alcohol dehydrogenase family)